MLSKVYLKFIKEIEKKEEKVKRNVYNGVQYHYYYFY